MPVTKYLIALLTAAGASLIFAGVASADPVTDLAEANHIVNVDHIEVGQVLHVPGQPDYVVAQGDTLGLLSQRLVPQPQNGLVTSTPPSGAPTAQEPQELRLNATPPAATPAKSVHPVNWDAVAACESGNDWAINTGNGFHGGLQFTLGTWHANGGQGMPEQASPEEQKNVADNVLKTQGIGAWPVCGRRG